MRIATFMTVFLAATASACGHQTDGIGRMAQQSPVERQACAVDLPDQWSEAIAASKIDTGGVTSSPRAVSPTGEVVAVRDSGAAHELLLIGADKSVRELYSLPDPDVFTIGSVGIDDRWIVFAVVRHPRNANGVLPQMTRIEIIDRQTGAVRTVAQQSAADTAVSPERNVLDSVMLSDGKVYWITRDRYNGDDARMHSFDPLNGTREDLSSGPLREILAAAPWSRTPAGLPQEIAGIPATDVPSVGTDGTSFGWISDVAKGGSGIGFWSPQTGVVKIDGVDVEGRTQYVRPVVVFDPFVIVGSGGMTTTLGSSATIVDTRSGAVVELTPRNPDQYDMVGDSRGGTLALTLWAGSGRGSKEPDHAVGILRSNALDPVNC